MGFALENFSAIGRWRTTEYGFPVDATGAFPDGTEFRNPAEFRRVLATQSDEFVKTLTTKLLTYALGRGVEYYDMPAVRSIMREAARAQSSLVSLDSRYRQEHAVSDEPGDGAGTTATSSRVGTVGHEDERNS